MALGDLLGQRPLSVDEGQKLLHLRGDRVRGNEATPYSRFHFGRSSSLRHAGQSGGYARIYFSPATGTPTRPNRRVPSHRRLTSKELETKASPIPKSRLDSADPRLARGTFTLRESAAHLGVPRSTLQNWARPSGNRPPLITYFAGAGREANVPFVGFAEAFVLAAFRKASVPMQRIRPAVERLATEMGLEHALASKRLYTDGAEVLYDYAFEQDDDLRDLTVVRTGQKQFTGVVREYLRRITYGADGWVSRLQLPAYEHAQVVVDPRRAFGLPLLVHGGARVEDLVDRFKAGDSVSEIAEDFAVAETEVEDVIRVATRQAG